MQSGVLRRRERANSPSNASSSPRRLRVPVSWSWRTSVLARSSSSCSSWILRSASSTRCRLAFKSSSRALGAELDDAGGINDFRKDAFQLGNVIGLTDFFDAVFDLVVIIGGRSSEISQVVNEPGKHGLECLAGLNEAVLELTLLEDDFLDAMFRIVNGADVHRAGDDVADDGDLGR